MAYLRENTNVPVPVVYHYDANPYNRLGGEYILMSKVCVLAGSSTPISPPHVTTLCFYRQRELRYRQYSMG